MFNLHFLQIIETRMLLCTDALGDIALVPSMCLSITRVDSD